MCSTQSSASPFSSQYLLISLSSTGSCSLLLPRIPLPSSFPSISCSRKLFLSMMLPFRLSFLRSIVCKMFLSFLTPLFVTHTVQLSFWSFSNTTFKKYPVDSGLLFQVFTFQLHKKLCCKCSYFLHKVYFFSICW